MIVSGQNGCILKWSYLPENGDSLYSPQLLVQPDGTMLILYGTGNERQPGGLYVVSLDAMLSDQLLHGSKAIYKDCCRGMTTQPTLIDVNQDEILDIVVATFNGTVVAFDGLTFEQIWNTRMEGGETQR